MTCLDCFVYPSLWWLSYRVFQPESYTLASQDKVESEKESLLGELGKWAVAKFENGFVSTVFNILLVPLTPRYTDAVMEDTSIQKEKM